jgi:hypothetical protein
MVASLAVQVSLFAHLARIGDNLTVLIWPVLVIITARGSLVEIAKNVWAPAIGRIIGLDEATEIGSGGFRRSAEVGREGKEGNDELHVGVELRID